jgi:hypothetical protein
MAPPLEPGSAPDGLLLIGWKEYLDFPEWGVRRVKAKVDTGARTSALDAARCTIERRAGRLIACMELALNRRRPDRLVTVEAPVLHQVVVTSSNGVREERPVVETTVRLGQVEKRIRLTVADRSRMLIPVLLGREALAGAFVVDAGRKYLQGGRHLPGGRGA